MGLSSLHMSLLYAPTPLNSATAVWLVTVMPRLMRCDVQTQGSAGNISR